MRSLLLICHAFTLVIILIPEAIQIEVHAQVSTDQPMNPALLESLLDVDIRGGTVLTVPEFDLDTGNALWQNQPHCYFDFQPPENGNPGHWFIVPEPPSEDWMARGLWSERNIPLMPNRRYLMSALIKADFNRQFTELNLGLQPLDAMANPIVGRREIGLPAKTQGPSGWERFEIVLNTPPNDDIKLGRPTLYVYIGEGYPRPVELPLAIADLTIVELPETQLIAADDPVSMVTFPGGPGALAMAVDPVETLDDGKQAVNVTGVRWIIDPQANTIAAHQRLDFPRPLATWNLDAPLNNLEVVREDDTVVVLKNDHVALGIQCDGMLAVYPMNRTKVTVTSHLGAPFVRYGDGHLLATDGRGGFGTNPYPPLGSGKLADSQPVTPGLDFVDFERKDLQSLSEAEAGWQIEWNLDPAERLFLSAFPPRPYDWEESFDLMWQLTHTDWGRDLYDRDYTEPADTFLLWAFHAREWGMSFGTEYLALDPDLIHEHVAWAHELGKRAIFYTSAWFFGPREPTVWTDAVLEEIDEFGFDGYYSDGLPAIEWLVGYEQMRITREALGDGLIIVHDSVPQSGRHPAALTPWIYTYATATYMAEHTPGDYGANWSWVRYVIGQHRVANAIGTIKGDAWDGSEFKEPMDNFISSLIWNARRGEHSGEGINERYVPAIRAMKGHWERHGDDPYYYDRYHVEKARQVSGFRVGPAAMPILETDDQGNVTLTSMTPDVTIHYTLDGTEPTADSPRYTQPLTPLGDEHVRAIAVAQDLEPSPPTPNR